MEEKTVAEARRVYSLSSGRRNCIPLTEKTKRDKGREAMLKTVIIVITYLNSVALIASPHLPTGKYQGCEQVARADITITADQIIEEWTGYESHCVNPLISSKRVWNIIDMNYDEDSDSFEVDTELESLWFRIIDESIWGFSTHICEHDIFSTHAGVYEDVTGHVCVTLPYYWAGEGDPTRQLYYSGRRRFTRIKVHNDGGGTQIEYGITDAEDQFLYAKAELAPDPFDGTTPEKRIRTYFPKELQKYE